MDFHLLVAVDIDAMNMCVDVCSVSMGSLQGDFLKTGLGLVSPTNSVCSISLSWFYPLRDLILGPTDHDLDSLSSPPLEALFHILGFPLVHLQEEGSPSYCLCVVHILLLRAGTPNPLVYIP